MRVLKKVFSKKSFKVWLIGAIITLLAGLLTIPVVAAEDESGFIVSQLTAKDWQKIYQHEFQVEYSTEEFIVDVIDGKVELRIVQKGTPFADIDQIKLTVDGAGLIPEYARYTENGESILEDILKIDNNVVLAHEQEIEISWDVHIDNDQAILSLTANEYDHGLPFRFPDKENAAYEMGSNPGSITVDGLISETDGTTPLYSPYWNPSSGHPDGYTYIYVNDDAENVYFSLDVTADNTNEFGEDWAELRILSIDGTEQKFRIDDTNTEWGKFGFGLTSKVSYKHKTCEFAIPKSIIGHNNVEFTLLYYGTVSELATITVTKHDTEGNPIEGWEFILNATDYEYTDSSGIATFTVYEEGDYTITEESRAGWEPISPASEQYDVTIDTGGSYGPYDFVNFEHANVTVNKYDTEGNPIEGWEINLSDGQSELTASDGSAIFTIYEPGSYTITEESRAGWEPISPISGSFDFTAESGGSYGPYDFVNFEHANVTVNKYDTEGNPIEGWEINLSDGQSQLTTSDGSTIFTIYEPG
jgi:hypothetical protein